MGDYLIRAVALEGQVRALAAAAALGRTMTGAALLGANLKDNQSLTLRINGDGPLGGVIVDVDSSGAIRGYVGIWVLASPTPGPRRSSRARSPRTEPSERPVVTSSRPCRGLRRRLSR